MSVQAIEKHYGTNIAVSGISFDVAAGETIALLGPNGAGKTTTISIIAGLLHADAGRVLVCGEPVGGDASPSKRRIGLVPQDLALYEDLSAEANLILFAALYGIRGAAAKRAASEALDFAGLPARASHRVKTFSGGMKRRLNLAAALLHDPELLLLDEPTVGVDPQSRNAIFDNLEALQARGKTLVYTTHYMEEAERLCPRILIIDHGRLAADARIEELYAQLPEGPHNLETVFLTLTGRSLRD